MKKLLDEVIGLFSKEEWALWVKGEFNLFDNYAERTGMSKEDADMLKGIFLKPLDKKFLTKEEVKSMLEEK